MKDKDAELMMEGMYQEQDPAAAAMGGGGQPQAPAPAPPAPAQGDGGGENMIPYSILGQLIQELENFWALGGKDAAQATTQSGQSVKNVIGDIVNMATVRAQNYSRAGGKHKVEPAPDFHGDYLKSDPGHGRDRAGNVVAGG